jgi:hypothetical protein
MASDWCVAMPGHFFLHNEVSAIRQSPRRRGRHSAISLRYTILQKLMRRILTRLQKPVLAFRVDASCRRSYRSESLCWNGFGSVRFGSVRLSAVALTLWACSSFGCNEVDDSLDDAGVIRTGLGADEGAPADLATSQRRTILDSGEFMMVQSERSGVAEAMAPVEWQMTEGIVAPLENRSRPTEATEPQLVEPKDADAFTRESTVVNAEGLAYAYIDLVGVYDALMAAAGPLPDENSAQAVETRARHRDFRRSWVQEQTSRMQSVVDECGVRIQEVCWSAGTIEAFVDEEQYRCLVSFDSVERITLAGSTTPMQVPTYAAGDELRTVIRADEMNDLTLRAQTGSKRSGGGPVRIAIFDYSAHGFNENHPVWLTGQNGTSRLIERYECSVAGCIVGGPTSTNSVDHGTQVTYHAVGSSMNGQVSAFPGVGTLDQRNRSGIAVGAEFYYYHVPSGFREAFEHARDVTEPDIITVSLAPNCGAGVWCAANNDCNSITGVVRDLVNDGTVIFWAAGNTPPPTSADCRVLFPGYRTEVVSVSNLRFEAGQDYSDTLLEVGSGRGNAPVRLNDGTWVTTPAVDLALPGGRRWVPSGASGFSDSNSNGGTSMATPRAAAMGALMRQSLNLIAPTTSRNARYVMVNLMLSGDGSNGTAAGNSFSTVDRSTGFGRLHAQWFNSLASGVSSPFLGAPWKWGTNAFPVTQGNTTSWQVGGPGAESAATTEYRLAVLWDEQNLESVNDIVVEVWNTCPAPAGSAPVPIAGDYTYHITKRIILNGAQVAGRCLEVRLVGYQVDGTASVYVADLLRSGTPEWL